MYGSSAEAVEYALASAASDPATDDAVITRLVVQRFEMDTRSRRVRLALGSLIGTLFAVLAGTMSIVYNYSYWCWMSSEAVVWAVGSTHALLWMWFVVALPFFLVHYCSELPLPLPSLSVLDLQVASMSQRPTLATVGLLERRPLTPLWYWPFVCGCESIFGFPTRAALEKRLSATADAPLPDGAVHTATPGVTFPIDRRLGWVVGTGSRSQGFTRIDGQP
jgi:hypothetical protein